MVHPRIFNYNAVSKIRFGVGALEGVESTFLSLLGKKIMIITDSDLTKLGLYVPLLDALKTVNICVTVFDKVEADPSLSTVLKAIAHAEENSVTGVVGFGGGSPMDVAKLTALISGSKENLEEAWGVDNVKGPRLPLCLIPTTSGTGSEVTPISIITTGGEDKRGIVSPILLPDLAVLDPSLTVDLPAAVTAATGIDAMVHAIEAFSSKSVNNNHLSKIMAQEALILLTRSIQQAVESGKNIKARSDMLMGSMMAGMAFANSPVAAVHALAYPLGGTFHIPHGLSNALVLSEVIKFNSYSQKAAEDYAKLAQIICPNENRFLSNRAEALRLYEYLKSLSKSLGLPVRLRDVDVPKSALAKLASDAMTQTRLLINNPRLLKESDALAIYEIIW